jgi:hypothetical protein
MPQESIIDIPSQDRLLRPSEIAEMVGLTPSTLAAYRKRPATRAVYFCHTFV